jgi:hypothetical protein
VVSKGFEIRLPPQTLLQVNPVFPTMQGPHKSEPNLAGLRRLANPLLARPDGQHLCVVHTRTVDPSESLTQLTAVISSVTWPKGRITRQDQEGSGATCRSQPNFRGGPLRLYGSTSRTR